MGPRAMLRVRLSLMLRARVHRVAGEHGFRVRVSGQRSRGQKLEARVEGHEFSREHGSS